MNLTLSILIFIVIMAAFQIILLIVVLINLFQVNSKIGELTEFKRQTIEKINNIEKRLP